MKKVFVWFICSVFFTGQVFSVDNENLVFEDFSGCTPQQLRLKQRQTNLEMLFAGTGIFIIKLSDLMGGNDTPIDNIISKPTDGLLSSDTVKLMLLAALGRGTLRSISIIEAKYNNGYRVVEGFSPPAKVIFGAKCLLISGVVFGFHKICKSSGLQFVDELYEDCYGPAFNGALFLGHLGYGVKSIWGAFTDYMGW